MGILKELLCDLSGGCESSGDSSPISAADMARAQAALDSDLAAVAKKADDESIPPHVVRGVDELLLDLSNGGVSDPFWPNRHLTPKTFDVAGYGLHLARQGTAPNVRLKVTIGASTVVLSPGEGFRCPFQSFTLQAWLVPVTQGGNSIVVEPVLPVRLIVERASGVEWVEQANAKPMFRGVTVNNTPAADFHGSGGGSVINWQTLEDWRVYPQGFSKLRVFMRRHEDEDAALAGIGTSVFVPKIFAPGCYIPLQQWDGPPITVSPTSPTGSLYFDMDVSGFHEPRAKRVGSALDPSYARELQALAFYWNSNTGTSRKARIWFVGIE